MTAGRIIALDAMGGDHGPSVVVPGAALAAERHPGVAFLLFGDRARIEPELQRAPALAGRATLVHTEHAISMEDKPSQAVRRGRQSSMWLALEAVQKGEAHVAVSAGNTGALMAMAKLCLRPIAAIERPAIAAQWPTIKEPCIVLDVGANVGASAEQLIDFALMGAAMVRVLRGVERPRVGLLNVGVEEIKGADEVKQAHAWLKQAELDLPIDYIGFCEGDQIGQGDLDVVVVEGFTGNIALKTAEGTARQIASYLRSSMTSSFVTKLGALLAKRGFMILKDKMDPRRVNGGTFLGLNGIAIKSHGGTDAYGFAAAIGIGYEMAERGLLERLAADVEAFHGKLTRLPGGPSTG
jgi:glycerol-3-phosphate acyltransferase PlsX